MSVSNSTTVLENLCSKSVNIQDIMSVVIKSNLTCWTECLHISQTFSLENQTDALDYTIDSHDIWINTQEDQIDYLDNWINSPEKQTNNLECTQKIRSAQHSLDILTNSQKSQPDYLDPQILTI